MVTPQVELLKHANKVISMAQASANIPLAKEFTINSQTQGALALDQNVANNPILQLAKSSGVAKFHDLISQKDVYTSH